MNRKLKWSLYSGFIGLGYGVINLPEGSIYYNGGYLFGSFIGLSFIGLLASFIYELFTKK